MSNIRETATPTARNKNLIINLKHLESNYLPKKKIKMISKRHFSKRYTPPLFSARHCRTFVHPAYVASSSLPSSQSDEQSHWKLLWIHVIDPDLQVKYPEGHSCSKLAKQYLYIHYNDNTTGADLRGGGGVGGRPPPLEILIFFKFT